MKTQQVPPFLRGFFSVFEELGRRWDYGTIFDDFLTLVMCCYAWKTEEEKYFATIKRYSREELELFPKLMAEWIMAHSAHQQKGKDDSGHGVWLDSLGTFYELILSKSKSQAFGQFFTPESLCDMLAMMLYKDKENPQCILDPCSGSGRLLLAFDAMRPGFNKFTAIDKDFVCVKMTCLNMMIHGIIGEVHHMNALTLEHYSSYAVNYHLKDKELPSIIRIKDEPSPEQLEQLQEQATKEAIVFDF